MQVALIVAVSENGVIGRHGELPWRLSADLRRFRSLTMGHHVLMGRKTFESIGRPLPGRTCVVLSRQTDYRADGSLVADSLEAALRLAASDDEVFVIGGEQVYLAALPLATRVYRTLVRAQLTGDAHFAELPAHEWSLLEESEQAADSRNEFDCLFQVLERTSRRSAVHRPSVIRPD